jgi:hypothetical protein
MRQIDKRTLEEHFSLEGSDSCRYIWEYDAGRQYDFSLTNRLIANLKIKPTSIAANPRREQYKQLALKHCAAALRALVDPAWLAAGCTFVPMPPSKIAGHADHDDRIHKLLHVAFGSDKADIRSLLEQISSTPANHETTERLPYGTLLGLMRINAICGARPGRNIAIVDDVLNSGKHFKVAQQLLAQRFPHIPVCGIFLARCTHRLATQRRCSSSG